MHDYLRMPKTSICFLFILVSNKLLFGWGASGLGLIWATGFMLLVWGKSFFLLLVYYYFHFLVLCQINWLFVYLSLIKADSANVPVKICEGFLLEEWEHMLWKEIHSNECRHYGIPLKVSHSSFNRVIQDSFHKNSSKMTLSNVWQVS